MQIGTKLPGRNVQISQMIGRIARTRIVSGAFKYTAINLLTKATGFLLLPLWTYLLTPADYGILGLMNSYMGIITPILMLGIDNGLFHRYHLFVKEGQPTDSWRSYLSSNLLFVMLASGTILALAQVSITDARWLEITGGEIPPTPYRAILGLNLYLSIINGLGLACLRAAERHNQVVKVTLVQFFSLQFIGLFIVWFFQLGAVGQLCGLLIGNVWGTVLLYGIHLRKQLVPRFDLQSVKQAIQYGLPLIPHAMAFVVMNATDRIMMSHYVSIREIGLFSFASTVMGVFMLVVNTLNQAWTPRYYEIMKQESRRRTIIEAYSACSLGLVALFNALGVLFGADLLRLVTVADYHGIRPYMGPLSLTSFFLATYYLGATPLYYFKQTKLLPAITLLGAVLNVGLNAWLIPQWGAAGAAYGTVISYAFITVACAMRSQQLGGLFMPYQRIYGLVLALVIIVICNYGLTSNEWWTVGVKLALFLFLSGYVSVVLCWPYRTLVTQTVTQTL